MLATNKPSLQIFTWCRSNRTGILVTSGLGLDLSWSWMHLAHSLLICLTANAGIAFITWLTDFFMDEEEEEEEEEDPEGIQDASGTGIRAADESMHEVADGIDDTEDLEDSRIEASEDENTDCDSDSNECKIQETNKAKRGRPLGWRKEVEEDTIISRRKRVKRVEYPLENIGSFMCCIHLCCMTLTAQTIATARRSFQKLSITERSQYMLDWIRNHSSFEDNQWRTRFFIGKMEVCNSAFIKILNFPRSTYYAIRTKFIEGKSIQRPGRMTGSMGASAMYFLMWINNFAEKFAEKLPDSFKFHLPCCLTKTSVHEMMSSDAKMEQVPAISYSQMMKIWRKILTHIKIPKKTRFSKCDTCIKIKEKISTCIDKAQQEELHQKRKHHLRQQNAERQKYYKHIHKAKQEPGKYASIIMDGMDQEKTSIPRFYQTPKSLGNIWKARVNLMGALIHGIGFYGFFDTFQWSHGASYTISILVQVLLLMDSIPDILYLQLDNCPGQNKNRYVIGFLAKLVEERILKKVKLSFLMVGHTHEDIDQLFSRFSVWCGNENILTLDELIQGFEKSCKRLTLTGIRTSEVYNFNEWLKLNNIRNHSFPHVFRITLGPEKKAVIKYKKWTTDKKWLACTGSEQYILQNMTEKMISKIPPNTEKLDKEKIKHDINIVGRFYEKPEVIEWWESFFNEMDDEEDRDLEQVDILQMLRAKKQESNTVEVQPLNIDIPNIEDPIPEVIIGKAIKPTNEEEMRVGNLVLTDTPLSPEDWPQVAEVLELLPNNRVVLQPYWGKKTTTWIPACRRPKGTKIQITVNRDVIWHYGFSLTPSGYLPKNVKDLVETYEEDNL